MASSANNSNSNSNNTNNSIRVEQNVHIPLSFGVTGVKRNRNINANMNGKSPSQQQQQLKNIYNGLPPQGKEVFNNLKHQDITRLQSLGYTIGLMLGQRDSNSFIVTPPQRQPYQFPPPPTCTVQQ
eukprot:497829_1